MTDEGAYAIAEALEKGSKEISLAIRTLANAITPLGAGVAHDGQGNSVGSLTEAVLSINSALTVIQGTLDDIKHEME